MARVDGGPVRPHVQAFADAVNRLTGITHIMTYPGHQPTQDRALDIFATREQGDAIAAFYIDNWRHFGGDYVIWWQRIWNPEVAGHWRQMANRGSKTANHLDHVHVSFEPTGAAGPDQGDGDLTHDQAKKLDDLHLWMSQQGKPGYQLITDMARRLEAVEKKLNESR